jgi:hypothetical protein
MAERWRRSYKDEAWPMRILANQVIRVAKDDRLLSNPFSSKVRIARLQNGDEMLFLATDEISTEISEGTRKEVSASVRYLKSLADEAKKYSLRHLVVLVPTKFAVYAPLTAGALTTTPGMPGHFVELEAQLQSAGLSVLNLYPILTAHAQFEAARHRYLYWRDDTHWNADGIAIAAESIAGFMAEQERSDRQ